MAVLELLTFKLETMIDKSTEHQERNNPSLLIASVIKRGFKKGDRVKIVGNIPFVLKHKTRPLIGKVTRVEGFYIYVRPLWQKWEGEWYKNELRHI